VVPLVTEAFDWEHGVFLGSIMSSETTAAETGEIGQLRFDPMAMLPFCGYHMGRYFRHWLEIGKREGARLPLIYYVNWFRKDDDGNFLWPGFGENSRVLAWIFRRCDGDAAAERTEMGCVPTKESLDTSGLDITDAQLDELLKAVPEDWKAQLPQMREHYAQFGDELPDELRGQLDALEQRLQQAS
jgi:phosphoenolpyruvate carboxykinase (GTP)